MAVSYPQNYIARTLIQLEILLYKHTVVLPTLNQRKHYTLKKALLETNHIDKLATCFGIVHKPLLG